MATRVGVLTFLHNDNYGSALQAYALQRALTALGAEAEHLDYRPSRREKLRNLLTSGNSPRLIFRKECANEAFAHRRRAHGRRRPPSGRFMRRICGCRLSAPIMRH